MLPIDLVGETSILPLVQAQAIIATANQTGIDTKDFIGECMAVSNIGAATAGTNPTMDVKIQDSADNASFADLATPLAFAQVTTVAQNAQLRIDRRVVRRYIRAVTTLGGTASPSFPVAVTFVGMKHATPATP